MRTLVAKDRFACYKNDFKLKGILTLILETLKVRFKFCKSYALVITFITFGGS